MIKIYNLIMVDIDASYDNHIEAFNIGFFSGKLNAEKTAKRYLTEVDGFKDYNISYQIAEKHIIGVNDNLTPAEIFIIYGWNENDEFDETDIIESDCYVNKNDAERELKKLKADYKRKKWCVDKYKIDECSWAEGFVKMD